VTPAQQARTSGFNASLSQRGVFVKLLPAGELIKVLVQIVVPESDKYAPTTEVRNASKIHILRTTLADNQITPSVGDSFQSQDAKTEYRVTEVKDNPADIAVVYTCETVTA